MKRFVYWLQLTAALARLIADIVRLIYVISRTGWV